MKTTSVNSEPRIIAGYGRSGTTWVQDVLAESSKLRPVFEPLHPIHIEGAEPFSSRYVPADEDNPALFQLLNRYINEDFWSLWADYRLIANHLYPRIERFRSWRDFRGWIATYSDALENFRRYRRQRRRPERIIKLVRANMMLGWLRKKFNARILFLIRHPGAVVASQLKASRSWDPYWLLDKYRSDDRLLAVLNKGARDMLAMNLDKVSALTLSWCIENSIGMKQAADEGLQVICYENLVELGDREWQRVLAALALKQMPDAGLIARPSQQAWGVKALDSDLIRKYALWMDELDNQAKTSIQSVLDVTGMNIYSVSQALPLMTTGKGEA